VIQSSF